MARVIGMVEAAALLGVDRRTMLRWVKAGVLPAQETAGGQHRVQVGDLVELMRQKGIPVPADLEGAPVALVVEDDELVARGTVAVVRALAPHLDVRVAKDGFEAGWAIAEQRPKVVLLDLGLPGLDGLEVIRRMRASAEVNTTAVIVVTGRIKPADREELDRLEVTAVLTKPITIEGVRDALGAAGALEASARPAGRRTA